MLKKLRAVCKASDTIHGHLLAALAELKYKEFVKLGSSELDAYQRTLTFFKIKPVLKKGRKKN